MYDDVAPGPGARASILNTGALRVRPVSRKAFADSAVFASMGGRLRGVAIRESTGAAACAFRLYDGADNAGQLVLPIAAGAGGFASIYFADDGVDIEHALFVDLVSGAADVTIFYQFDTGSL